MEPLDVKEQDFDSTDAAELEAVNWLLDTARIQRESAARLRQVVSDLEESGKALIKVFKGSNLQRKIKQAEEGYKLLKDKLAGAAIQDPSEFSSLIQRRQAFEGQLSSLDQIEGDIQSLNAEALDTLDALESLRLESSAKRSAFLGQILSENDYVRMTLVPFGNDPASQESEFRRAIAKQDTRIASDVLDPGKTRGILAELYEGVQLEPSDSRTKELMNRVRAIKENILATHAGAENTDRTQWFRNHIQSLRAEQLDRIRLWWPEDTLQIEYRQPQQSGWAPLSSGSPGQKSAALLAFLLSYGEEPLILDQPEDDLDNHLIYDLIVERIRANKRRRQVIVATHNANIVVNGDAEQVVTMDFRKGQCKVLLDGTGCLQDMGVREEICQVMEGGREAFDSRQKRLAIGAQHAT